MNAVRRVCSGPSARLINRLRTALISESDRPLTCKLRCRTRVSCAAERTITQADPILGRKQMQIYLRHPPRAFTAWKAMRTNSSTLAWVDRSPSCLLPIVWHAVFSSGIAHPKPIDPLHPSHSPWRRGSYCVLVQQVQPYEIYYWRRFAARSLCISVASSIRYKLRLLKAQAEKRKPPNWENWSCIPGTA